MPIRRSPALAIAPRHIPATSAVVLGVVLTLLAGMATPALAAVSRVPASGTPELAPTGKTEQVRQLVQCGRLMYAVGSFASIRRNGTTYARNNVFSFSATAPYSVTAWNPNVNGVVNSIAFNGTNCSVAYIGGQFSSVHGTAATDITAISTATGAVDLRGRGARPGTAPGSTTSS